MRRTFEVSVLERFLQRQKIATIVDLKAVLHTSSDATVFRMLKSVGYCTSYSHRGRYYTMERVAVFDEHGLWCCRSVFFSEVGTLVATAESFVAESRAGYYADELEGVLHVNVKGRAPKPGPTGSSNPRENAGTIPLLCQQGRAQETTDRRPYPAAQ